MGEWWMASVLSLQGGASLPLSEVMFAALPSLFPKLPVPPSFSGMMRTKRSAAGAQWMLRNEMDEGGLAKGGWNLFIISMMVALVSVAAMVLVLGTGTAAYGLIPSLLAPIILSSLYLNAPESYAQAEERRMLRESPSIIGCMTMSMQVRPSLEQAVTFAAERGEGVLAQRLKEALWANVTRAKGSLNEALDDLSATLSRSNDSLRQSLHLVISATCERTKEGMDRLLDKANAVALGGVRDAVDSYISSLTMPTMVLFSLGTLLPIMMFSLLPLLSLGTSLSMETSATAIPFHYLAFILLVVIPASALIYAWSILSRNPLGMVSGREDVRSLFPPQLLLGWGAIIIAVALLGLGPLAISGAAVLTPCPFLYWRLRNYAPAQRSKAILEKEATAALFQAGNRMVSGSTAERALESVALNMKEGAFVDMITSLLYRHRLTGKKLEELLVEDGTLRAASPVAENAYATVLQCARRDPMYAGQIALHLAQMLSDLRGCQSRVEEKLRGVVDMMRSTGTFFAPMVLGVTGAMFSLIGQSAGSMDGLATDLELVTGLYIGELSLLVSFFTVLIMGERSWKGVVHCYATRTPVAFLTFVVVSIICRTGLIGLM